MTSQPTIEANVPQPASRHKYADWGKLGVGDSVFIPLGDAANPRAIVARIRASYQWHARTAGERVKFTSRVRDELGVLGVRVWRVE